VDYELSDVQRMIQDTARKVGESFGLEYWRDRDAAHEFPHEAWQGICDAGLCGVALPEEYGGSGLGMIEVALVVEEVAAGGAGATIGQLFITNPCFGGVAILNHGTPQMREEMLPKLVSGELKFCMALTEPDAGINTTSITSFAGKDGDGWRLNGRKIWITSVPEAQKMLIIARTQRLDDVERKTHGISLFMVDVDRAGLTYFPIEKAGTNTLTSSNVFFDNMRIEPHELIGTEHRGWIELWDVLNTERLVATAAMVGAGRLALRLAVEYVNERKVFGKTPIGTYQSIQHPLAEAHALLSCAREMNLKAAWLCDNGLPYASEANTAKFIGARGLELATERAMKSMGGMGYARASYVERLWRDGWLSQVAPIPEEMILNFIAQQDLGLPRSY
jgi:acyl-CoA dehydrogenase